MQVLSIKTNNQQRNNRNPQFGVKAKVFPTSTTIGLLEDFGVVTKELGAKLRQTQKPLKNSVKVDIPGTPTELLTKTGEKIDILVEEGYLPGTAARLLTTSEEINLSPDVLIVKGFAETGNGNYVGTKSFYLSQRLNLPDRPVLPVLTINLKSNRPTVLPPNKQCKSFEDLAKLIQADIDRQVPPPVPNRLDRAMHKFLSATLQLQEAS